MDNAKQKDEIVPGPIKGVRFWRYRLEDPRSWGDPPRTISSFQWDIEWTANKPAQSDLEPTMENGRGLNVYSTIGHAIENSADAVNGVIDRQGRYDECKAGLVLGVVECTGPTVIYERGYHPQFVKPTRFFRGWGWKPDEMVEALNVLWFSDCASLSLSERVMLAIQRNGTATVPDISDMLKQTMQTLDMLERKGYVKQKRAHYDDRVMYEPMKDKAWQQGVCLTCGRAAREECKGRPPRLYQLTLAGQNVLLHAMTGDDKWQR